MYGTSRQITLILAIYPSLTRHLACPYLGSINKTKIWGISVIWRGTGQYNGGGWHSRVLLLFPIAKPAAVFTFLTSYLHLATHR